MGNKKILVMCGTGVATSTLVTSKIKDWLESKNYNNVTLFQSKVGDEISRLDDYDVVVSTTIVPDSVKDKVIFGISLLTGVGTEELFEQIEKELLK